MVDTISGESYGTVGTVSTGPPFEATTTFLPIIYIKFTNSAARPADRYKATWPQSRHSYMYSNTPVPRQKRKASPTAHAY